MEEFTLKEANQIVGNLRAITQKLEKMNLDEVAEGIELLQKNSKEVKKLKVSIILLVFISGVLSTFIFLNYLYAIQISFFKTHNLIFNENEIKLSNEDYKAFITNDNQTIVIQKVSQKPVK